ncbi:MAG: TonB-dependent receptor [Salinisphaeraceae bacterium]|nr:TonB-dependent receptor [Salinisphaeraceae bacterium]
MSFSFPRAMPIAFGLVLSSLVAGQAYAQSGNSFGQNFNPKLSLILQGSYADYSQGDSAIRGALLGGETELRESGFSLVETEIVAEANIDNAFRGWVTLGLHEHDGETEVDVEEAYINTLALPQGFTAKFGRFFSDIGYLNRFHSHAWDFIDQPIVYRALLANSYKDDGVQLKWIAPTDVFLELGAEAMRGAGFPGGAEERDSVNAFSVFGHLGGDIGVGGSWRLGLWHLGTDAAERASPGDGETQEEFSFTGDSDLYGIDLVYKWAPNGNPSLRHLILQAEYIMGDESGTLEFSDDGTLGATSSDYTAKPKGFYTQAVYQFVPRWRVGVRYDSLQVDNSLANNPAGQYNGLINADDPERVSLMVDFSPSEFSRFRVQYNKDDSQPGGDDDQIFLQYIMSLGAHPAHQY